MNEFSSSSQDPAEIERDIRQTQEDISRTVDRIGDQLTPRSLVNALLDQAENNNIDARTLLDGARRNPLALAMIAGGAIWLASDSDAKLPSWGDHSPKPKRNVDDHRDYMSHMERVELRDDEDASSYQRRRDIARSNYFVMERQHDEDDKSFRQRLDEASDAFRRRRHDWMSQVRDAGSAASRGGQDAVGRAQSRYASNPLVGGLVAAAAGAFFGSMLPETRMEQERLSGIGEKARDLATEQGNRLMSAAREQKDELVATAEQAGHSANGRDAPQTSNAVQPQPVMPT